MTYTQALDYIHSTCWKGSRPGLERTIELTNRLGNPQNTLKFIHIAGTNGKGSTSAMLASVLQKAGFRVGLYTSPFILRFNKRMRVDGQDIPDDELAEITEYVKPHAEAMGIPAEGYATMAEGVKAASRAAEAEGKALLCLGSLYMYGEVLEAVEERAK